MEEKTAAVKLRRRDIELVAGLLEIEAELQGLPAFIAAHPDQQPDAVLT